MSDKERANLLAIADACLKIQAFITDIEEADAFYADSRTFDAVLMNIIVIGESVTRLPDEILDAMPDIEWRKIKGLRNMIAHDYFGVDAEVIWQIIGKHIPELLSQVQGLINHR